MLYTTHVPRVVVHNLSIRYTSQDPHLFYFDENGIFFAQSGDIVVSRRRIGDAYASFLHSIGCLDTGVSFVSGASRAPSPFSLFEEEEMIRAVIAKKGEPGNGISWSLDYFMLTEWEAGFARKASLSYEGNPDQYYAFGSKSFFREAAKRADIPIPAGSSYRKEPLDIGISMSLLFLKGFAEIVVKQDEGVAGLGSRRVRRDEFIATPFSWGAAAASFGVEPVRQRTFAVEGWYESAYSPSIQLHIDQDGAAVILSIHKQLFYPNKMTYMGCVSHHAIPGEVKQRLESASLRFAEYLSREGYRGHLTFNAIVLPRGEIVFTELNPRRVMSSYAFEIARRCARTGEASYYTSMRIERKDWMRKSIADVLEDLSPALFSPSRGGGLIPYDHGLLGPKGQLSLLSIGADEQEAAGYLSYATSR